MTFSSLTFLFLFFPIVFLLYIICANNHIRNGLLIIASLLFYGFGEPIAVVIMLISICINYLLGLLCGGVFYRKTEEKYHKLYKTLNKSGIILAILMNIGLLFVYKYLDFFLGNIGLSKYQLHVALPIGISFFTFQGLSYVIDVYRNPKSVQKNLFSVMLYISFFPQLIAGPIVKYHDISEQLHKREFNLVRIGDGIQRFVFGLGKKVLIAGPMGLMADSIYGLELTGIGAASAWLAAISYMLQIFFDFSGYSDMAIGLGCIFGFDFKENFNKPYAASHMQDFWRRWHISLSTWFKEYVYIPLGGNRKGSVRTYINKFIVFLLTGLWHGANWTFVCWGILHGLSLTLEDLIRKITGKRVSSNSKLLSVFRSVFGHVYTLLFVMLTFVVFRADYLGQAWTMIRRLFATDGSNAIAFSNLTFTYILALAFGLLFASSVPDKIVPRIKNWILKVITIPVYVLSIVMLVSGGYNPFIYFRF